MRWVLLALVALLGASPAVPVNAVSFAASALPLTGLPAGAAPRPGPAHRALRDALQAMREDPLITRAVLLVNAALFTATALTGMVSPLDADAFVVISNDST